MVKLKKYPYAFIHFGIFLTFKKGSDEILLSKIHRGKLKSEEP